MVTFVTKSICSMAPLISGFLFVYSSLRVGFQSQQYEYIRRYFTFEGEAMVKGILSDLGDFPVATPTTEDCFIKGELYRINDEQDFSFAIGQLDDYEGVDPEADQTPSYKRELTVVFRENETQENAWIYWYNGNVEGMPRIQSGDVNEYVKSKKSN